MLQCLVPGRRRLAAFVKEERYGTHISNIRTYTRHRRNNAVLNEFHLPILGIVIPNRNDETILQCRIAVRLDTGASTATRPSVGVFLRSRIGGIAIVYTHLVRLGPSGRFRYPVIDDIAFDFVDAVTVGSPVDIQVARPPSTAGTAMNMLIHRLTTLAHILGMNIILRIMRMSDHDMRLLELRQQIEDIRIMLVFIHIRSRVLSPVTERNMGTKENNLVRLVLDQVQIGFQPIILLIQKSGFIIPRRTRRSRANDIIHHNDMCLTSIK